MSHSDVKARREGKQISVVRSWRKLTLPVTKDLYICKVIRVYRLLRRESPDLCIEELPKLNNNRLPAYLKYNDANNTADDSHHQQAEQNETCTRFPYMAF